MLAVSEIPQLAALPALLARAATLTDDEVRLLAQNWAHRGADGPRWRGARARARHSANRFALFAGRRDIWITAGNDAWCACWRTHSGQATNAVRDAVWALVVRDLLDAESFARLTQPWRETGLPL